MPPISNGDRKQFGVTPSLQHSVTMHQAIILIRLRNLSAIPVIQSRIRALHSIMEISTLTAVQAANHIHSLTVLLPVPTSVIMHHRTMVHYLVLNRNNITALLLQVNSEDSLHQLLLTTIRPTTHCDQTFPNLVSLLQVLNNLLMLR